MGAVVNAVRDAGCNTAVASNGVSQFGMTKMADNLLKSTSKSFELGCNTMPIIHEI